MREFKTPGRNACAFASLEMLSTIPGVVPILHSGAGCGLRSYDGLIAKVR